MRSKVGWPAATISVTAAWLSIAAVLTYQVLLLALIFLRPDLDPSWHTISEWAIRPSGWVMSGAFFISAMSYAALFVLLRSQVSGTAGRMGLGVLLVCIVGTVGVGLFTTDPLEMPWDAMSLTGRLHVVFGSSALMLLPVAALLLNLSLALHNETWRPTRRALHSTAGLPLVGFSGFVIYTAIFVAPLGPNAHGPGVNIGWPPRIALLTYMVWLVTVAGNAIALNRRLRPDRDRVDGRLNPD
jgi:Protein of unknown function (DUF998)